jgi:putative transposase
MRKSKFTDAQIAFILRHAEEGTKVEEVCRKAAAVTPDVHPV